MLVGALVLMFIDRHVRFPSGSSANWTLSDVLSIAVNSAVPIIGVLLASRRPENRLGWLFLTAGFGLGLQTFGTSYGLHALVASPGSLPAGRALAWLSNWVWAIPIGMLSFLFLLFPTGRLRSRRWLPVAWYVAVALVMATAVGVYFATRGWRHPFSHASPNGSFAFFLFIPVLAAVMLSVSALVVRFRGSEGDERLQLKWFVTAAVLVAVTLVVTGSSSSAILSVVQSLAFVFLWVAISVAVLKYRLYEIDVVISKTVVYGVLAAFFTSVYVAVVVGIGTAVGSTHNPFLTVLAAAVIALAFNPVRTRATRFANRIAYGRRASPYEVLSQFSERMAGTFSVEDVLPQMAAILGEGTGARQSRVWLRVGREMRPAASWGEPGGLDEPLPVPDGQLPDIAGTSKVVAVRHRDELLGALAVTKPANEPLSVAEGKLVDDLAAQAGLVLRNVRLTEELRANLEELRASRQRLVAAQDQERRRIERNIHDGAQQQLVALAVKQRLAASLVRKDPEKTVQLLEAVLAETTDALENLRDLARGIYPPLLADQGLVSALTAQARKSPVPVSVEADGIGRFPQDAEAAVYFCALEALQNVAKYAEATAATVHLFREAGHLAFEVTDDGVGFDSNVKSYGTGIQGMADRLAALGGELTVTSSPGQGTRVIGNVPVAGPAQPPPTAVSP
jgi:signal transduction histidine kinase